MAFGDLGGLALKDIRQDLYRNIVSLRESQDLFDDLSDDPADWQAAINLELAHKPPAYESPQPVIDRPFEEAALFEAIQFPFDHWGQTRFSRGTFGVWYGSEDLETTIYETAHHWYQKFLADAGYQAREGVSIERRVHLVHCDAALINLLPMREAWPELLGEDYAPCQMLGERIHRQGHPGLWTPSARSRGNNAAVMTPRVLSDPRVHCYLTYRLEGGRIAVYRTLDQILMML